MTAKQLGGLMAPDNSQYVTLTDGNGNLVSAGGGGGSGTVTSVSVTTANGVSGSVATSTTTPAITLTLGAITPTSVAIGAGSAITSSGAGGSLGSNAFTSTAYAPLASPTFTGTVTHPDASTWTSSGLSGLLVTGAGTVTNPAIALTNFETNTGFYVTAASKVGLSVTGVLKLDYGITTAAQWTIGSSTTVGGNLSLGASTVFNWTGRGIISSPGAGVVQIGSTDSASPVAQTLKAQAVIAGTSNTAGTDWILQGSLGTGTGKGGAIFLKTAPAGTTGTSQNAAITGLKVDVGTAILTSYVVASLPTAATAGAGATAFVTDASTTLVLGLGGAVTGGGANKVPVYSDGTNWNYG